MFNYEHLVKSTICESTVHYNPCLLMKHAANIVYCQFPQYKHIYSTIFVKNTELVIHPIAQVGSTTDAGIECEVLHVCTQVLHTYTHKV